MINRPFVGAARLGVLATLAALVCLAIPAGGAGAVTRATAARPDSGIDVFPVSKLKRGMTGHGLTVIEGTEVDRFRFEVLGVQEDGIAPGIDFILVKGYGKTIRKAGGFAAGFSGSPVYIDGKLLGAIAYGFFGGDFKIGGVTPAGPMLDVMNYPKTTESMSRWARTVHLDRSLHRRAVTAAGGEGQMRQLSLPLAISGLNGRGMDAMQRGLDHARLPFAAYNAGSTSAAAKGGSRKLEPGSTFSAMLSYGDLTAAAIGTTTAVDGDKIVAFGHPFFFSGAATAGISGGKVLTVVKNILIPFKFAVPTVPVGKLTQDRLAAVAGRAGDLPLLTAIRSDVRNLDLGTRREGLTKAVRKFEFMPDIAFFALLVQVDRVFDRIGPGSAEFTWTIKGEKANGNTFTFRRSNLYDSEFDVSFESLFEIYDNIYSIDNNDFARVSITSIELTGGISETHNVSDIEEVTASSSSNPEPVTEGTVFAQPGDTLTVNAVLHERRGETTVETFEVLIPDYITGSLLLQVTGGSGGGFFDEFLFDEPVADTGSGEPTNFADFLAQLENAPHNNDLVVTLLYFSGGGEEPVEGDGGGAETLDEQIRSLETVINGSFYFDVFVEEPCPPEGCPPPEECPPEECPAP